MDLGTYIVHYEGKANLEVDILFIKLDLNFFCKNQQIHVQIWFIFKTRVCFCVFNKHAS